MNNCSDILIISTLACQIADCLSDDELELLAANIVLLGDTLAAISVKRIVCNKD